MTRNNGLRNRTRLTQNAMKAKDADALSHLQAGGTDQDMADQWGVSAGTVANVRNQRHDLSRFNWLKLAERFGPDALNPVLALVGAKAVHDDDVVLDVHKIPHQLASVLPLFIELFEDNECCDNDVRKLQEAGAIDCIIEIADMLRQRRDGVRLKAVGA